MDARTLKSFVNKAVSENVTLLASDEHPAYTYIDPAQNERPIASSHMGAANYVRGDVHTNNIENFWSLPETRRSWAPTIPREQGLSAALPE